MTKEELLKLVETAISDGSIELPAMDNDLMTEAITEVLDKHPAFQRATETPEIGMTDNEVQQYSITRAIQHQAARKGILDVDVDAGLEIEASKAVADKTGRTPNGMYIPHDVMVQKDLTVGTDSAGGYLRGTDHDAANFIELLRNKTMVAQLGARMLTGLMGDVAIPKQSGGATAYWVSEGSALTESSQTFGQLALAPSTLGAYSEYSRKLLVQSDPSVDSIVSDDLFAVLAIEIDRVAINGSGSGAEPTGILGTNGIGDVAGGTNGLAPTYANIVNIWREVAVDNGAFGSTGFLTNPKVIAKLMTTDKGTDTGRFVAETLPGDDGFTTLLGVRCGVTNQVPSDLDKGTSTGVCSAIIYGNFNDAVIAQWGGYDLIVNPYSSDTSRLIRVSLATEVDFGVRNAVSFAAMQDALTT